MCPSHQVDSLVSHWPSVMISTSPCVKRKASAACDGPARYRCPGCIPAYQVICKKNIVVSSYLQNILDHFKFVKCYFLILVTHFCWGCAVCQKLTYLYISLVEGHHVPMVLPLNSSSKSLQPQYRPNASHALLISSLQNECMMAWVCMGAWHVADDYFSFHWTFLW